MRSTHLDLVRHSAVYGAGLIASRMMSVLLLPIYTRYLSPADYGVIAILDITAGLLAVLVGAGIAQAVQRFHFDSEDPDDRARVWWTGLAFVATTATVLALPAWWMRESLARLTLGAEVADGAFFYALVLPTMWFSTVTGILQNYVRVRKWSNLFVVVTVGNMLINVGLNLWFLIGLDMGVAGILLGNLIGAALLFAILLSVFARALGRLRMRRALIAPLVAFGAPILVTTLLHWVMHEADRYFLRHFLDVGQVGLYSIAYQIGYGVNTLLLVPFLSIWTVVIYEIAEQPDAREVYARVFRYYVCGTALVMLGVSIVAGLLVRLLTTPRFYTAAEIVPIVCLAYVFFSLDAHFRVPALLAKRTATMLLPAAVAAVINLAANLVLIPRLGAAGAAWAAVVTFACFAAVGLWRYRRIDRYPYPLATTTAVVAGMIATYLVIGRLRASGIAEPLVLAIAAVAWLAWAAALFGPLVVELRRSATEEPGAAAAVDARPRSPDRR